MKKVKYIIKNYFITIFTNLLVLIVICSIFFTSKVEAGIPTKASSDCKCDYQICNHDLSCISINGIWVCPYTQGSKIRMGCDYYKNQYCAGTKGCGRSCVSRDCDRLCPTTPDCGPNCVIKTIKSQGGCQGGKCVLVFSL